MFLGQRARLTWSTTADGTVATQYISFLGLNERELPKTKCPSCILMIPIEGLAVGGVNPDCKSVGYVALVCIGTDMETDNFINCRNTVFRKYVSSKRNAREGVPIPEEELAVAWKDGGGPQLKAITREYSMATDEDMKCIINKHYTSLSTVEQPMDLISVFMFIIRNQKKLTSKRRAMIGFKQFVYIIFWELQKDGTINLSLANLHCYWFYYHCSWINDAECDCH